jgi:hypothetical protein
MWIPVALVANGVLAVLSDETGLPDRSPSASVSQHIERAPLFDLRGEALEEPRLGVLARSNVT